MFTLELAFVVTLILVNGFLAMSELAVVSARRIRLQALAQSGNAGAGAALSLLQSPGRFLSSVQIGITLVGVLAGTFSGATLAQQLETSLQADGLSATTAETVSFAVVVAVILISR